VPDRREFVKGVTLATTALGMACGGGVAGPSGPLTPPSAEPRLLRVPLMAVGQTVAVFEGELELAVTRTGANTVVAVSRRCTHEGCTVLLPSPPVQTLDCPCHGSRYTTGGTVLQGPALQPLNTFPARIEGSEVVITLR
jgi:cytochrome b6-f complex iron-sulfur subunit